MTKFLLPALAAAIAIAAATPALAATSDTGTVTVTGTVAGKCQFTTKTASISVGELAKANGQLDPATLKTRTAKLVGWCNETASTMAVTVRPMIGTTATTNTLFTNRIDLVAQAVAAGKTATDTSVGEATGASYTAGTPVAVDVFSGDIDVTINDASTATATALLTAGTYTGYLDVTLAPAS